VLRGAGKEGRAEPQSTERPSICDCSRQYMGPDYAKTRPPCPPTNGRRGSMRYEGRPQGSPPRPADRVQKGVLSRLDPRRTLLHPSDVISRFLSSLDDRTYSEMLLPAAVRQHFGSEAESAILADMTQRNNYRSDALRRRAYLGELHWPCTLND